MATVISYAPRSVVKIVRLEGLNNNLNGHTKSQKGRGIKEDTGDWELNTLERIYSEKDEGMTDVEEVWFAVRVNSLSLLEWQCRLKFLFDILQR